LILTLNRAIRRKFLIAAAPLTSPPHCGGLASSEPPSIPKRPFARGPRFESTRPPQRQLPAKSPLSIRSAGKKWLFPERARSMRRSRNCAPQAAAIRGQRCAVTGRIVINRWADFGGRRGIGGQDSHSFYAWRGGSVGGRNQSPRASYRRLYVRRNHPITDRVAPCRAFPTSSGVRSSSLCRVQCSGHVGVSIILPRVGTAVPPCARARQDEFSVSRFIKHFRPSARTPRSPKEHEGLVGSLRHSHDDDRLGRNGTGSAWNINF